VPHSRFLWKLYLGFLIIIALAIAVTQIFTSRRFEADSRAQIESSLRARSFLLGEIAMPALRAGDDQALARDLQARVSSLGKQTGMRLTVIRDDGRVLADSEEDPSGMGDHGTRPEVLDARQLGEGRAVRFSDTLKMPMMYFALALRDDGALLGYARGALPLGQIHAHRRALRQSALLGALIAALAAMILGLWIARRISRPLQGMTAAAKAMAEGRRHLPLPQGGRDEISELAKAFETMSGQLQVRMESLASERNKLRAILSAMVEGVVAVNGEERVLHMNDVAGRLLDADPRTSIGRPLWEVARTPAISEAISECLEQKRDVSREIRQVDAVGQRVIALHASPLEGEGNTPGVVLVLQEVTELRRLESVRRDFVANVSHELKTPLTAIRGLVETLAEDGEMPEETRQRFLRKVRLQTEHLSIQVSDLLTLSRLESMDRPQAREPVDLTAIARGVAGVMATAAEAKKLRLDVAVPETPLVISGDSDSLRQALSNLVDNAIKYTPEGGQVTLRLRREGSEAIFEVEDTGIGIEPRHQQRVFERFYRVDKSRSREMGGTGLGLAIVRHAAIQHGGRVDLSSQPGKGSRFTLALPLNP